MKDIRLRRMGSMDAPDPLPGSRSGVPGFGSGLEGAQVDGPGTNRIPREDREGPTGSDIRPWTALLTVGKRRIIPVVLENLRWQIDCDL